MVDGTPTVGRRVSMQLNGIRAGPVLIHWWGAFIVTAFIAGYWHAGRMAKREGLASEHIAQVSAWVAFGAAVGARLFFVLANWSDGFTERPWWQVFNFGGGSMFYGGFAGGVAGVLLYCCYKNFSFWRL